MGSLFCASMSEIILILVIFVLILYMLICEYLYSKERSLYLDRLMAKDLAEYKAVNSKPVKEEETVPTEFPIDSPEAMEDILDA